MKFMSSMTDAAEREKLLSEIDFRIPNTMKSVQEKAFFVVKHFWNQVFIIVSKTTKRKVNPTVISKTLAKECKISYSMVYFAHKMFSVHNGQWLYDYVCEHHHNIPYEQFQMIGRLDDTNKIQNIVSGMKKLLEERTK